MTVQQGVAQNDAVRASMTTITPGEAHVPIKGDNSAQEKKGSGDNSQEDGEKDEKKKSEGGFKYFLVS
jgi:hypothetical protein